MQYQVDFEVDGIVTVEVDGRTQDRQYAVDLVQELLRIYCDEHDVEIRSLHVD